MNRKRLTALAVGVAITAAACGGAAGSSDLSTDSEAAPDDSVEESDDPTTEPAGDGADSTDDTPAVGGSLVSPTETDRPFDLAGGATSSDEGVTIVAEDTELGFSGDVGQAVAPWTTDWSRRTVDLSEFLLGIRRVDPRDSIPPIDLPKFEPITAATWLDPREPGALVRFNDEVRFYPLSILTRHEVINDRFGDIPVVITFCPLCNTAVSFDARVDGQALRFGVSGLLRRSDLVMWDSATTSLWQQITGEGVVGEFAGTQLDLIPTSIVSYGDVLDSFPDALSLSQDTGFGIAYGSNSYAGYSSSQTPFGFDGEPDPRFPALSRVVGVSVDGIEKAYPFSLLSETPAVNDEIAGLPVVVLWGGDTADALDARTVADGQAIGTGIAFDRRVGDQILTFTSIEENRFTDSETGTVWTLLGQAVEGPLAGEQLDTVQHRNEFWFAWASFFPGSPVYGE